MITEFSRELFTCSSRTHNYVWVCVGTCDSFTRLQSKYCVSFQPLHLVSSAFPVCCAAPASHPVRRIKQWSSHSSLVMTWYTQRVGWRRQREGERGVSEGSVGERGAFLLQQALFSPHSPGHHTPAGTHLIMDPVWR